MTEALISAGAAVVVGLLSLVGVMITNSRSNSKMQNDIKTAQAVTEENVCIMILHGEYLLLRSK